MLFFKPATGSGKLVLGDAPAGGSTPALDFSIDADFADAPPELHLAYGVTCAIDAAFDDGAALPADLQLAWDANVSRTTRAPLQVLWQAAAPVRAAIDAHWQQAQALRLATIARWQAAQPARAALDAHWQDTERLRHAARVHWQQAALLRAALDPAWQETEHLRASLRAHHQQADLLRGAAMLHWQETLRLRHAARTHWQQGAAHRAAHRTRYRDAQRQHISTRTHWQEAWRPRSGVSGTPQPPEKQLCYDPATLGQLVFERAFTGTGELLFICRRAGSVTPEPPPAIVVLARRRTYIVINSIEVRRVDTNALLPALDSGFSMQLERGSWTWGFSVEFHASALPLLQPDANGLPVELEVKVNGQPFRMMAESLSRSVKFPRAVVRVTGASPAVLLDAPWAPQQSFTQDALISAEQLMLQVLTVGGVSMGWTLDWQITDWTIPAGTWAHQGTWISAINDIAGSVGAYVQPHDTAHTLRILPAWPVRSWLIPSATPDIELPPGIAAVEEVQWIAKPAYDSLYLRGEAGTFNYYRKRSGTPGTVGAPMVVHPLLIAAAAADQRAIAELSDTGRQVEQQLQLMVHPETGIIKPGTLLRYTDDAAVVRTGITREVSVQMAGSKLTQTIRVQAPEVA